MKNYDDLNWDEVLKELNALENNMNKYLDSINGHFSKIEKSLDKIDGNIKKDKWKIWRKSK